MKASALRFLRSVPLLIVLPLAILIAATALAVTDLLWLLAGSRRRVRDTKPDTHAASLVIPNWNGRDLLERFLPTWLASIGNHPGSEIIVVDNGSDDGSAEWIAANYPQVRVLALKENLGFGGGSNTGFRAAQNDIVVLLNSDMRVEPDFLAPLLAGFTDAAVFAVSCQIFLGDPTKRREETGLTEGSWQDGMLHVGHREDSAVNMLFPCLYGGGGSCAFDRKKFLALGGFDDLLAPFYLEDTDLGFMAWKRGWKVLYQPASVVHHEHRGTIGKRFSAAYIESILQKNFILFAWKNIHEWSKLGEVPGRVYAVVRTPTTIVAAGKANGAAAVWVSSDGGSFVFSLAGSVISAWSGDAPGRYSARGVLRATMQIPGALRSRWHARELANVSDSEGFHRSQPAIFHDRFSALPAEPERPRVLFVSPYPICPPTHGGGVFMYYTLRELARTCDVHAIVMLDYERERAANEELRQFCQSVEFVVHPNDRNQHLGSITPHAVHEFRTRELAWLIERQILLHQIDVLQLEYTAFGQYARRFNRVVCALFEHDVYFQSIGRVLPFIQSPLDRLKARFEYLRAIRFELGLLPRCDHIQVCTLENKRYLESFLPELAPRIDAGMRAGVDVSLYAYPGGPRRPRTILFLGSFRHTPNQAALDWFTRAVLPLVLEKLPDARLLVAGSDPPPRHAFHDPANAIDLLGFVDDIQPLFTSCAVFI